MYDFASQARGSLARYLDFYNIGRPHLRLDRMTPDSVYFNELPQSIAAKLAGDPLIKSG